MAKTLRASEPGTQPQVSAERLERVAASIAEREPALRARATAQFPGDLWSQDDAYHAHEQELVRAAAARQRMPLGSVLWALDSWLRTHPSPERESSASPCKPRPFYD